MCACAPHARPSFNSLARPQQDISNRRRTTLEVALDDLEGYSKEAELVARLERNTQQVGQVFPFIPFNRQTMRCHSRQHKPQVSAVLYRSSWETGNAGLSNTVCRRQCTSAGAPSPPHSAAQYLALLAEAADNIMPSATEDNLPEDVFDVLVDQVGGEGRGQESGGSVRRLGCAAAQHASERSRPPPAPAPALAPVQRRRAQEMHRAQMEVEGRGDGGAGADPNLALPPSLLRRYEVLVLLWSARAWGVSASSSHACTVDERTGDNLPSPAAPPPWLHACNPPSLHFPPQVLVHPRSKAVRSTMRGISAECIGSLVTFKGIVTQARGARWGRERQPLS